MRNITLTKVISAALILTMAFTLLVSCAETGEDDVTTPSAPEVTTPEETTPEVTTPEATTPPEVTTPEATTPPEATTTYAVDVPWNFGYVGSDTNASYKEKINKTGTYYSYSDIIKLGSAGTTITFTDDNTNSDGDSNYASAAAYVFSSWKETNGTWVLDSTGYKANGTAASYTDANGARTYTYTTTKDNECIRLCFRSGQSSSFTPSQYPTVTVVSTTKPEVIVEKAPETTQPPAQSGTELNVKWNNGYVGSSTNGYGYANKINANEVNYAYTDVIEIAKKGTKITFTDPNNGSTSGNAYVVSSWKKSGSDWVIDLDAANIPGGSTLVISSSSAGTVYTYITGKDNECIRFCYRSNNTSNKPKLYSSQTNEPGTADGLISQTQQLNKWLEDDKTRAYYDVLEGKTFSVIGDSYLAGNGLDKNFVWPALLSTKYGMTLNNYGMNGSTMSNYVTTNNPMVNRYTNMAMNNPDIIIIEGGRNDYNKSVPIGEDGSLDTKTMKGAARYLITKMQERYPNAVIICVTCWEVGGSANSAGNVCSDYGRAFLKVCEDMGVPCINAMDSKTMGVYMTDSSFRSKYCMGPNDISHLNLEGMKLVMPVFEKFIADFYTAAKTPA